MKNSKARSDAWDAALTDAQRWMAYDQMRRSPWYKVSEWAAGQFGVPAPSRTALYNWARRMRGMESARRVEQAVAARDEIGTLAEAAGQKDAHLVEAFKAMAVDIVMSGGNAADAARFTQMALAIAAAETKRKELDLKDRAQQTKDEALRLAREKFETAERRLERIREAVEAGKTADGGLSEEGVRKIEAAAKLL